MVKIKLSIRIDLPGGHRLGPGKAALLTEIQREGSLSGAARKLGMSYPRALKLVEQMNTAFDTQLVKKHQGGKAGGKTDLTEAGMAVLEAYRQICSLVEDAASGPLGRLSESTKRATP